MMIDNGSVAIMTSLNELAAAHGVKPYEFVATYHEPGESSESTLRFDSPPPKQTAKSFETMLANLGALERLQIDGTDELIYETIQTALKRVRRGAPSR